MSKSIPIAGTGSSVSFFEDDTLETVRQHIAAAVNSHPDRLFMEVNVQVQEDYYEDPRTWDALFLRMSIDGLRLDAGLFKYYTEQIRPGISVKYSSWSREDWNSKPDALSELFAPGAGFSEWRVFGVPASNSIVLPLPFKEFATFISTRIPIGNLQLLYESLYTDVGQFRATEVKADSSAAVKRVYFPLLREDTPNRLSDSSIRLLRTNADQLTQLLKLSVPEPTRQVILRAKWYVPLVETSFTAPRSRFEQMFYGLTVSNSIPYVGYFTSKQEKTRHKFFVRDPSTKVPSLDLAMWKAWTSSTLPQRRLPTLLLYRGTSRTSFDRIAITPRDIQFTVVRGKESKSSLEDIRLSLYDWFQTFDAITPFIEGADVAISRWELQDMTLFAQYSKEVTEFDMRRFQCLQTLFSYQDDTFRLLRADRLAENFTPVQIQAFQALQEAEIPSPNTLIDIGLTPEDAETLFRSFLNLGDDLDLDRVLRGFPTIRFSNKEVILSAVTSVERTLQYASLLRHILTTNDTDVDAVCPRRVEVVAASTAEPLQVPVHPGEFEVDDDFLAELGLGGEPEPAPEPVVETVTEPPTTKKRVRVNESSKSTYNYFNKRLQEFDPETFDSSVYPSRCDKNKQVVVLTPEDEERIPAQYNPRNYPATEKQARIQEANSTIEGIEDYNVHIIPLTHREGIATCPQYWCIKDELPLREDQLVEGACPVCKGKVRSGKDENVSEFTVIKRDQTSVFPNYIGTLKDKQIPCCYKVEQPFKKLPGSKYDKTDDSYVLSSVKAPAKRLAYIPETLAPSLYIPIHYSQSIKKNRLDSGKSDFFCVGLGRPSLTLPYFLKYSDPIPEPNDAPERVMRCSFARSWTEMGEGTTQIERIVSGIQTAYKEGRLSILDELEYVTSVIRCNVIRVNTTTATVKCGFWTETLSPAERTIVMMDDNILAHVSRSIEKLKGFAKYTYTVNLRDPLFPKKMLSTLTTLHQRACSSQRPRLSDALQQLQSKRLNFQVILDPFERVQAVFVPKVVILPIQPSTYEPLSDVHALAGYNEVKPEDLPTRQALRTFLDQTTHPGFKWVEDLQDVNGRYVESLLASEFRAPFQPEESSPATAKEVLSTLSRHPESELTEGLEHPEDVLTSQSISYAAEVFDFLMVCLSKDIQTTEYTALRESIATREKTLYKKLDQWLKKESHWDAAQGPRSFINKVRTPCGQFKQKDACSSSSLCGWKAGNCKIKVDSSVDRTQILRRLTTTLIENEKQRALVLDDRVSPFFSTVLYMEMPHELITTNP
jgi:hypothetical protein